MGLLVSDDFNRANGALGANWTDMNVGGGPLATIVSGAVTVDTPNSLFEAAYWSADVFPDDQFSQVTVVAGALNSNGVIVRASGSGASFNFYSAMLVGGAGIDLRKYVAGSFTSLGLLGSGGADGDVIRISAVGSTLQVFINGVQQGADVVDTSITSGSAGLMPAIWGGVGALDNWSGGLAALATPLWIAVGPQSGHVFAEDSSVGTISLTGVGNADVSDDTYVTFTLGAGQSSHYLKVTDFMSAVPLTADISGVLVEVERSATVASAIQDENTQGIRLVKGGAIVGDGKADLVAWSTTDAYSSYGNSTDTWGVSWSPAQINAVDFGVVIAGMWLANATGRVDHVRITVYYVPAGRPQTLSSQQFQVGDGMSTTERHSIIRQH
jgi:hypothetical protein